MRYPSMQRTFYSLPCTSLHNLKKAMFQQILHVLMKKPPVFSAATSVPRIVSSGMLKHPALKGSSKIDLLQVIKTIF